MVQLRTLSTRPPESLRELLRTIASEGAPAARELAGSFLAMEGSEEYRSMLSSAEKATRLWSSASPAGEISTTSTFQLAELVSEVSTIYLMVDEEQLTVDAGFLRVMVGCVIDALTRGKHLPRPKHEVLLLLDEAAALGSLEPLERGVV
ncbi:type IV secretory system conjugative DNA transfer family protein [Bradyrhizobium vignae]|uniref:Plasmid transfer factor TraG n=1 Tax=Bradyrhizobium vignae TaxID=1549949 RepID=A0A2U3Q9H9_9BRAD